MFEINFLTKDINSYGGEKVATAFYDFVSIE